MYIYIYIYVHTCVYIYIYMSVYVCMYVCMYVYIYIYMTHVMHMKYPHVYMWPTRAAAQCLHKASIRMGGGLYS